jgi:LAO/AO transport system kinase
MSPKTPYHLSLADIQVLLTDLQANNIRQLAKCISLVENEIPGYQNLLQQLPVSYTPIIGITGAPGAGKSTLADALIGHWVEKGERVGVLCVDPSSPFNRGALLGDRIRMNQWYTHPQVFIRSLASRGALGGLHPQIIAISDVMKASGFNRILVETVGVGQSEIEIAGLADVTVVVLVPEGGDEIQTLKSGVMEIADIFALNKADRPGAAKFMQNLKSMLIPVNARKQQEIPVIGTVASQQKGIDVLATCIDEQLTLIQTSDRRYWLQVEKLWQLIMHNRMKDIKKEELFEQLKQLQPNSLYQFMAAHYPN